MAERDGLTVILLPGYAPELNPVEGLWAHIKRSPADLAARTSASWRPCSVSGSRMQYQHSILGGFLVGTGLALG